MKLYLALLLLFVSGCLGDLYMHNPRGSNNRVREENVNRNNANRMFDSQNNGKGGYCLGPSMYFYEGSLLSIEWTNQHGCGMPRLYCNLVIQYMCTPQDAPENVRLRDGTTTDRIPNTDAATTEKDTGNNVLKYGLHEPRSNYVACDTRSRNMGLWISDRQKEGNLTPGRRTAKFTRQNNNGNRHAFECPEERDYYPYWHPSPWKDIAVLADSEKHCDTYKKESQNVKEKHHCLEKGTKNPAQQNNEAACAQAGNDWVSDKIWGISSPECIKAPWNRDNHLGNALEGKTNSYNWTIPDHEKDGSLCVLRMRYNISTNDGIDNSPGGSFTDAASNAEASPVKDDEIMYQDGLAHQLAIDTSQFGRTFQDRSHVFIIKKRPSSIPKQAKIYNLNVRGKRGNIVETYPAVEYDFVPSDLHIYKNDYVHFQWTGCDKNPGGNAGEGTAQTDKSNIVQIATPDKSHPVSDSWLKSNTDLFSNSKTRKRMAMIDQPVDDPNLCKSFEELLTLNNNNQNNAKQDVRNCMKLNAAGEYFDGGVLKMKSSGNFYYMSSRNNNFTNRDQKGSIIVSNLLPTWAIVIVVIGSVLFLLAGAAGVGIFYSRSHPHSSVAKIFTRI
jgi:hypothetical protein